MKFQTKNVESCQMNMKKICLDIDETLKNINETVNNLRKNEFWIGDAADYYFDKFNALSKNFDTVHYEIYSSINHLQYVINDYSKIDKQIVAHASSFFDKIMGR